MCGTLVFFSLRGERLSELETVRRGAIRAGKAGAVFPLVLPLLCPFPSLAQQKKSLGGGLIDEGWEAIVIPEMSKVLNAASHTVLLSHKVSSTPGLPLSRVLYLKG